MNKKIYVDLETLCLYGVLQAFYEKDVKKFGFNELIQFACQVCQQANVVEMGEFYIPRSNGIEALKNTLKLVGVIKGNAMKIRSIVLAENLEEIYARFKALPFPILKACNNNLEWLSEHQPLIVEEKQM